MPRKKAVKPLNISASNEEEIKRETHPLDGLTVGRMVHFTLPSGAIRPAVVVHIWNPEGVVNLQVFTDSDNTGTVNDRLPSPWYQTSIAYHENPGMVGTWHFIKRM